MEPDEGPIRENHENGSRLLERERVREQIRTYLSYHYQPSEIYKKLGLSRSGYYRHLRAIKRQDQEYIAQLRGASFSTSVRLTIESLQDLSRELAAIAQSAAKDSDKVAALELRYRIELDILNVKKLGPTAVPITHFSTVKKKFDREDEEEKFEGI